MAAPDQVAALRRLMTERFPSATRPTGRILPSGLPAIDDLSGGLPLGALTEIVAGAPSCGSHLLLGHLLATTRRTRTRVALVDGSDSFDPASHPEDDLAHLVWVRCEGLPSALGAADLLTRDANLGLVLLDLRRTPEAELRRTPSTLWYRLQRAVEPADLALVVITPAAAVPSAQLRFLLPAPLPAEAAAQERRFLATTLAPIAQRQRMQVAAAG